MKPATTATLLVTMLLALAPVRAGSPIDQARALDPRGLVEVSNPKGLIEVRAWNRPEVRITGELGKGVEKLEISGGRDRLRVRVRYPERRGLSRFMLGGEQTGPTTLRLMVPLQADLDLSAVSADVIAWGVAPSKLKVENVSGRTTVAAAPLALDVGTVSGDVRLTVNRARIRVDSVSGDISLAGKPGNEITLESVSGDIDARLEQTPVERFDGVTVSGDMHVRTALAPRSRMKLETVSGDIDLSLPRTLSADVRAESFSGTLRAPGAPVRRTEHGPGASLRQRYGEGDGEISITTFSGDANLRFDPM